MRREEEQAPPGPAGKGCAPLTDQDAPLWKRARAGDRAAFSRLVERHHRRLFNSACRMLGDREGAEDVVQETFLSAFRHLGDFEGRSRFSTWITAITMNRCRNVRRAVAHARTTPLEIDPPAPAGESPESQAGAREIAQHIQQALAQISPEHREVLILRDVEGLSRESAGEILGVETGTVKSRLHRARKSLRVRLEGVWPP